MERAWLNRVSGSARAERRDKIQDSGRISVYLSIFVIVTRSGDASSRVQMATCACRCSGLLWCSSVCRLQCGQSWAATWGRYSAWWWSQNAVNMNMNMDMNVWTGLASDNAPRDKHPRPTATRRPPAARPFSSGICRLPRFSLPNLSARAENQMHLWSCMCSVRHTRYSLINPPLFYLLHKTQPPTYLSIWAPLPHEGSVVAKEGLVAKAEARVIEAAAPLSTQLPRPRLQVSHQP